MQTPKSRVPKKYVIAASICIVLALAFVALQGLWLTSRAILKSGRDNLSEHKIQDIIERSNAHFESAETHFKENDFQAARNMYKQAMAVFNDIDVDVHHYPRLLEHLQRMSDQIVRRQMSLRKAEFVDTLAKINPASKSTVQLIAGSEETFEATDVGIPAFDPSPLDDLAKLELKKEAERAENLAKAKAELFAADLDFKVKPDSRIQDFIHYHQHRGRRAMESGLRRAGRFVPLARQIFYEQGVPKDLVWMAQVESAWSPRARSWASAVGLWQFIPATGKRYGLRQNIWIDERMSFEKATQASAKYLRWLNRRYDGDWALALAGYNAGEAAVDRAIGKAGLKDFWKLSELNRLPKETCNYVPNIMATIIIAKNPKQFGFNIKTAKALEYSTFVANSAISLRLLANAIDVPYDSLMKLNP